MKYSAIILGFLILAFGCKKKEAPVEETPVVPAASSAYTIKDYMPLKYGNYWVYERTITDTNNVIVSSYIDSCYVYDSIYENSKWFYRISGIPTFDGYFTDSSNCIINRGAGETIYLNLIHNDTLTKTASYYPGSWCTWTYIMDTNPGTYVYNSNTYTNCINKYCYYFSNMNPNCPNWILDAKFAPGVGLVYTKYGYINSCDVWEDKLLRYKIN